MTKNISIHVDGVSRNLTIGPKDKAGDVLTRLGLTDHKLFHGDTEFSSGDSVYDHVVDGASNVKAVPLARAKHEARPVTSQVNPSPLNEPTPQRRMAAKGRDVSA